MTVSVAPSPAAARSRVQAFVDWLLHATRLTRPALRVLYDVFGQRPPREWHLERLSGHAGSLPVRVGNAARDQLYRYAPVEPEGAFGICGFWAVEHLARGGGTLDEAMRQFERLLAHANDVGLFGEEIDPRDGSALGNFPQSFTHIRLINAALALEERARGERVGAGARPELT